MPGSFSLGLDIGGTFTDFVLLNDGTGDVIIHKYLTSYPDASAGVLAGLDELLGEHAISLTDIRVIVHSTTLVTNAIIEQKGATAGLIATEGFPNVLDLGREQRYDAYDLFLEYPKPLVPPTLRAEVRERTTRDGIILTQPESDQIVERTRALIAAGVDSLAVALLHSYANPENEQVVATVIRDAFPALPLSLSSEVAPIIGEWERTSTTVADAYVRPIVDRYLAHLETELRARGFAGHIYITLSSGGTGSIAMAKQYPIRLLESGPAAGVLAAVFYGGLTEHQDVLAFDMGGTTAKACLVEGGTPFVAASFEVARVHRFKRGSGLPIAVPALELIEIGAGGGSIARKDELGVLKVGPLSAGADPGPACYGLGGNDATVTDANLVLGYYDPAYFVGGRMQLYRAQAEQAIAALGTAIGLTITETAWGIHTLVNENMAAAARIHVIERGRDPRMFAIIAFGGGGPCHGTSMAHILGAKEVIIPLAAGTTSALGSLAAPFSFELSRSRVMALAKADWAMVNAAFGEMEAQGRHLLRDAGAQDADICYVRSADMRMLGQLHAVRVTLPDGALSDAASETIRESFYMTYLRQYRYANREIGLEFVNWNVRAIARVPQVEIRAHDTSAERSAGSAKKGMRPAYFAAPHDYVDTPVYDRYRLVPGMSVSGPAIIEERESTSVLRPGDCATVDRFLNLP